ncbi:unnamed protein product [Cyclocybe aegerita]|uniref:Uncharacterized protein n=1 Tax=Cyclocybe aegerita TaxID=1973307 RepID=A0A8S0W0I6_CYCAE|nr:unnamed protein product [Cyclocybe aegerita]
MALSPATLLSPPSRKPMVHLLLSSPKGNQGLRYFPYSGYLGLTPVRIEGVVRTKLDADLKTLPAKSISVSVRCYETRVGRVNTLQTNVLVEYTTLLWSKPDNVDHEHIGNLEFPFRINLPAKVAGFSTAIFVDYRCTWRVEAVLNHAPIAGVGSRQIRHFELPLIRYDVPSWLPSLPPPQPLLSQHTSKPRAPRIRYSVSSPRTAIGPLDLVSIPLHLQPLDQGVSIRSASVIVERRIYLHECPPSGPSSSSLSAPPSATFQTASSSPSSRPSSSHAPTPSPTHSNGSYSPTQTHQLSPFSQQSAASTLSINSSQPTITPSTFSLPLETTPLLPPSSSPNTPPSSSSSKVVTNPIAGAESSGTFARDANGVWTKTLTLQWPAAKSHSRWAIGETIISDLVSVRFFVKAKIIITSPSGTETLELAEHELLVVSTNDTERQLALAKYNETHDASSSTLIDANVRSKSKSPRRSQRPGGGRSEDEVVPPSPAVGRSGAGPPPSLPTADGGGGSSSAGKTSAPSSYPYARSLGKSSTRRPHTSAGPRDKPVSFAGGAYQNPRGAEGEGEGVPLPAGTHDASGGGSGSAGINGTATAAKRRSDFVVMRPPALPVSSLFGGSTSASTSKGSGRPDSSHSRSEREREREKEKEKDKDREREKNRRKEKGQASHTSSISSSRSTGSTKGTGTSLISGPGGPGTGKLSSSSFWSTVHSNPSAHHSYAPSNSHSHSQPNSHSHSNQSYSSQSHSSSSHSHSYQSHSTSTSRPSHVPGGGRSKIKAVPSGSSTSTTTSSGSVSTQSSREGDGEETEPSDYMREWEEELARIEMRSRRSSDAVGFAGKTQSLRKRSVVVGVPGVPPVGMAMQMTRVADASS